MTTKMTPVEYLRARREALEKISPEDFIAAQNYTMAAMRACCADRVATVWETIASVNELALRLAELYPDGMPLTFEQLADMETRGLAVPPHGAVVEWWRGL